MLQTVHAHASESQLLVPYPAVMGPWMRAAVAHQLPTGGHLHFRSMQSKHLASSDGDVICARRGMLLREWGSFHSAQQQDQAA